VNSIVSAQLASDQCPEKIADYSQWASMINKVKAKVEAEKNLNLNLA